LDITEIKNLCLSNKQKAWNVKKQARVWEKIFAMAHAQQSTHTHLYNLLFSYKYEKIDNSPSKIATGKIL
jgi:hypothetical protein